MTLEKHMLFPLPVCLGAAAPGQERPVLTERRAMLTRWTEFDPRIVMLEATDVGTSFHTEGGAYIYTLRKSLWL